MGGGRESSLKPPGMPHCGPRLAFVPCAHDPLAEAEGTRCQRGFDLPG